MGAGPLLSCLSGYVAAAVLVVAGWTHAVHRQQLVTDLRIQRLFPVGLVPVIASLLPLVELLVGLVIGLELNGRPVFAGSEPPLAAAAVALYAAFVCYSLALLARRDAAPTPCGCSSAEDVQLTVWVPIRAGALALLALVALVSAPSTAVLDVNEHVVVLLAAATFTVLFWTLPVALQQPDPNTVG